MTYDSKPSLTSYSLSFRYKLANFGFCSRRKVCRTLPLKYSPSNFTQYASPKFEQKRLIRCSLTEIENAHVTELLC